jgi:hypothetical protein
MIKIIRTILILLLLSSYSKSDAQNIKFLALFDLNKSTYPGQILVGYLKDETVTGIIIRNDTSNFEYCGRILDKQKNEYIIFQYFNEQVGCTNLYLFAVKDFKIFSSQAILETEVPIIFSFDRSSLIMWIVTTSPPNCGKNTLISFEPKDIKEYKTEDLKGFKTYLSLDL